MHMRHGAPTAAHAPRRSTTRDSQASSDGHGSRHAVRERGETLRASAASPRRCRSISTGREPRGPARAPPPRRRGGWRAWTLLVGGMRCQVGRRPGPRYCRHTDESGTCCLVVQRTPWWHGTDQTRIRIRSDMHMVCVAPPGRSRRAKGFFSLFFRTAGGSTESRGLVSIFIIVRGSKDTP